MREEEAARGLLLILKTVRVDNGNEYSEAEEVHISSNSMAAQGLSLKKEWSLVPRLSGGGRVQAGWLCRDSLGACPLASSNVSAGTPTLPPKQLVPA